MTKAVTLAIAAAAALCSVSLGGCANLGQVLSAPAGADTMGKQILQHIELCDRTYRGALGAGVTGSFEITCRAQTPADLALAADPAAPIR